MLTASFVVAVGNAALLPALPDLKNIQFTKKLNKTKSKFNNADFLCRDEQKIKLGMNDAFVLSMSVYESHLSMECILQK